MTTTGTSSLTTTERVIDGVHRNTADLGSATFPAISAGLADGNIFMLQVADLANSGHVDCQDLANFTGGEPQQSVFSFLGHQLSICSGSTGHLAALTGIELNIVDDGTQGNLSQRQSVSGLDIRLFTGQNIVTDTQSHRGLHS